MSKFLDKRGNYVIRAPFEHYLDTNGDGTGVVHATGDYSPGTGTPTVFFFQPAVNETVEVTKLIIHVGDKGAFGYDGYGALAGSLANGVVITVHRLGAEVLKLTNGVPITTNADLSHLNTDYRKHTYVSNYESSTVSFDVQSFGTPLQMHGDLQDQLRVELSDDFTGLDDHHFIIYGRK